MTSHIQIQEAAEAIAARLEINARRLERLVGVARDAGWSSLLDQLGAVLIAAHAGRGRRGVAARDPVARAIRRGGPRHQHQVAARVAKELSRRGRTWRRQYVAVAAGGKRAGSGRKPRTPPPAGAVA